MTNPSDKYYIHNPPEVNQLIRSIIDPEKGENLYHPHPENRQYKQRKCSSPGIAVQRQFKLALK